MRGNTLMSGSSIMVSALEPSSEQIIIPNQVFLDRNKSIIEKIKDEDGQDSGQKEGQENEESPTTASKERQSLKL